MLTDDAVSRYLQTVLDRSCDLARVRAGHLLYRVSLPDREEDRDLSQVILDLPLVCVSDDKEIRALDFVPEERCSDQVVVQHGNRLSRFHVAKVHKGRRVTNV
ncbi:hypothetical protein BC936DRAFT_138421 [Jimgerdemannia flammicorona]|uniref:Uncharacterized protein n=2 Tax=Jimgerdemannia flammicorona TaxID=994334 RepID=A0A433CHU2_9FUNG|nr:hypothetical protein BC936DRAFT_138421 [Jimgerdemannia flammicorona]RUS32566.1 hypothetical protein BC938DRAFT_475063 [Jimgerdemannia flammicorona]